MYPKLPKMVSSTPKLVHPTTQALKSGKINLMIPSPTSGLWVVLSMKWPH